jgi:hypothetical protein
MENRRDFDDLPERQEAAVFLDAEGNRTDQPSEADRGEVIEYDEHGKPVRRTWFFMEQVEIKWLPVSEAAFLLWVLGLLLAIWLVIGLVFGLV